MGGTQYLLAVNGLWTLAATGGAMAGLLSSLILLGFKTNKRKNQIPEKPAITQIENGNEKPKSIILSMSAYIILVVLGFTVMLIPQVNEFLGKVRLSFNFPDLTTAYGWQTPAGPSRKINLFGHPGAILLYTSVIAFTIYRLTGYLKPGSYKPIIKGVLKSGVNASLGVLAMVSLATIMMHSGMTNLLARGLSESFNRNVYPAIAPFIGALGAFITGSNNNSNVLFGVLQMDTASLLNLSVPLILAAQTAGGSLGSVMSPAKVIVGCSTVGLTNKEGLALRKIILYGLIPLSLVAVIATLLALG
jgi:lactate permease